MGKFRIAIEYLPHSWDSLERLSIRTEVTEEAVISTNNPEDIFGVMCKNLVKQLMFEYQVEKDNLKYKPREKPQAMPWSYGKGDPSLAPDFYGSANA